MKNIEFFDWALILVSLSLILPVLKILADVKTNMKSEKRRMFWYVVSGYVGLNGLRIFFAAAHIITNDIALTTNLLMNVFLCYYFVSYLHKTYLVTAFSEFQGDTGKAVFWDIEKMIEQVIEQKNVFFDNAVGTLLSYDEAQVKIQFVFNKAADYGIHFHFRDERMDVLDGTVYVNEKRYRKGQFVEIGECMIHTYATDANTTIITTLTKTKDETGN